MTNKFKLDESIKDCLRYFGPSTVGTIQNKLMLRGIEVSQIEILNSCEFMTKFKQVEETTGFHGKAFKLKN